MAKPNRTILSGGERYRNKKEKAYRVEEVSFNKEDRLEYLTGFHKRKVERRKHAEEFREEQRRQGRIEERAQIRAQRQQRVQERLAELDRLKVDEDEVEGGNEESEESDDSEEDSDEEDSGKKSNKKVKTVTVDEEWHGFDDSDSSDSSNDDESSTSDTSRKSILKKQVYEISAEDAPVQGTSEVVIESLSNPHEMTVQAIAQQNHVDLKRSSEVLEQSINRARDYARLMGMTDPENEEEPVKKRRKKKHYLSNAERKRKKMMDKKASLHRHKH